MRQVWNPGRNQRNIRYEADNDKVGFFIWDYDSVWLPSALLQHSQSKLAETLFNASRQTIVSLHFNKGLAGAPTAVIEEARDTPMNPSVCGAFALAICCEFDGPAYPGVAGHEPDVNHGRNRAKAVQHAMNLLRAVAPDGGAYTSESNYREANYQTACWGKNYRRLASIKQTYDPDGIFFSHNGVGSEQWSDNGFTRTA